MRRWPPTGRSDRRAARADRRGGAAYDLAGIEEAEKLLDNVQFATGPYLAMDGADALVIITEWNEFRALDMDRIKTALAHPLIIDLRNIYDPNEMKAEGFKYVSVGRS